MADIQLPDLDRFSLQVTVYFKPEDVPTFFEEFRKCFDNVWAEKEIAHFEVFQDPHDPGKISWIENWDKSPQWFMESQLTKEYYKNYFAVTEALFVKPREFRILKRMGPPFVVTKEQNYV